MSRLRQALAAVTMTVTAAAGGLLIAVAGAVPAGASAPAHPAGEHSVTITAHHRAGGIGPHDVLPCVARSDAAIKPASCGQQTISCVITVSTLAIFGGSPKVISANARTNCTAPVDQIYLEEDLGFSGGGVLESLDKPTNTNYASTVITRSCVVGSYFNVAAANITFPAGYVLTGGTNPIHSSASITFHAGDCTPSTGGGGGGGGGGCAVHAPSPAGHQAGRRPHLISCS